MQGGKLENSQNLSSGGGSLGGDPAGLSQAEACEWFGARTVTLRLWAEEGVYPLPDAFTWVTA